MITVNSTPIITCCSLTPTDLPIETKRLLETMKSVLAEDFEDTSGSPELLIGADIFWDFMTASRMKTVDGIYLIPTSLGIVLGGSYKSSVNLSKENEPVMLCLTERNTLSGNDTLLSSISWESRAKRKPDIEDFWSLETIGITDNPEVKDDDLAMENFNKTIEFNDGRYQVGWPWRENASKLPTNYSLALGRLKSLLKRFAEGNSGLLKQYNAIFTEQLEKNIIEKIPATEKSDTKNITHYLAHHAVVKEDHLTTKLRIVFDGSAKCGKAKPSLNECLLRGPVIQPDLCSIQLRFRLEEVAIVSDVEKAFLQIGLKKTQRDDVRFLWLKDASILKTDNNVQIYRFQRVPFGTISSPFLLAATIRHHLEHSDPQMAAKLAANMYVDNCIVGAKNDEEAVTLHKESKRIFKEANMNLREFCSNSKKLHRTMPKEDQCSTRIVKVFGLVWNSVADTIQLQQCWSRKKPCLTKREAVKLTASVFDPIGYFQPAMINMKCFIRDIVNLKLDWDDRMPNHLIDRGRLLLEEMMPIFAITIPRFVGKPDHKALLLAFSGASANAYAACVYLRVPATNGWKTNLIYSKSRLTPKGNGKKEITIPRLELLGLTIAVKMSKFVRRSLMTQKSIPIHAFCDSSCVLSWIRSNKILERFVQNRITQIGDVTETTFWHVKGEENPADLVTRGVSAEELTKCDIWWHGPKFLENPVESWPTKDDLQCITSEELQNINTATSARDVFCPSSLLSGEGSNQDRKSYPCDIDANRFSTFRKLLRVTCISLKFIKQRIWKRISDSTRSHHRQIDRIMATILPGRSIRSAEIQEARLMWVKSIQANEFKAVKLAIDKDKRHPLVIQLNLELDDQDAIRCRGRLSNADLPFETLQPLLLPEKCHVTRLIIAEAHHKVLHDGVSHTVSELRRTYWVPQGRQAVQTVISRCPLCKRFKGHEFALPKMPPLPQERVARARPFEYVGLDILGPINVVVNEQARILLGLLDDMPNNPCCLPRVD